MITSKLNQRLQRGYLRCIYNARLMRENAIDRSSKGFHIAAHNWMKDAKRELRQARHIRTGVL